MSNEYIPNGHEHANGNGQANGKAFVLTQPKTPADIQRDSILATMPKLRRHCSKDPRLRKHIGAKWMFGQISDLTFLSDYGGDGFGKLFISIKDLNRIFGHDVKSLTSWRDKLVETGWIWVVEMWPKSQWGICGICRQPELFPAASEFTRTMAKSSRNEAREGSGTNGNPSHPPPINAESEDFPLKEGNSPGDSGKDSHSLGESFPPKVVSLPIHCGNPSGETMGRIPIRGGKDSHGQWETFPPSEGILGSAPGEGMEPIRKPLERLETEEDSKRLTNRAKAAENGTEPAAPALKLSPRQKESENDFLAQMGQVVGRKEMEENGGLWRTSFRQNKSKAWACLAETRAMAKEGRIKTTPAKAMMDLWVKDRLNYDGRSAAVKP